MSTNQVFLKGELISITGSSTKQGHTIADVIINCKTYYDNEYNDNFIKCDTWGAQAVKALTMQNNIGDNVLIEGLVKGVYWQDPKNPDVEERLFLNVRARSISLIASSAENEFSATTKNEPVAEDIIVKLRNAINLEEIQAMWADMTDAERKLHVDTFNAKSKELEEIDNKAKASAEAVAEANTEMFKSI